MKPEEADDWRDELDVANPYASPSMPCISAGEVLPAALAAEIDRFLEPGEGIVWQGRPQFPVMWFTVVMLFQTALLLGLLLVTVRFTAPDPLLFGTFLFIFVGTIVGSGLLGFLTVRRTALVLTTRRTIICRGLTLFPIQVQIFLPEEVHWKTRPIKPQTPSTRVAPADQVHRAAPPWYLFNCVADRPRVRNLVCNTLLPELARRLLHTDPLVRRRSAACFAKMGPAAAGFAQSLTAALRDDDGVIRRHAAIALGNGRVALARAELERLRFDDDRRVAQAAIDALDRLPFATNSLAHVDALHAGGD